MSERIEAIARRLGIDRAALSKKYRDERSRRIRPDHTDQYTSVVGDLNYILRDSFVEPGYNRAPRNEDVEVAIVGAGFGGILAGVRLRQAGIDDIHIIDEASDFGGTWYWNRYPGAQCDIESYCYIPLLEEIGYIPKERYAYAEEIFDVSRRIAKQFDLEQGALFRTRVTSSSWNEETGRWVLKTNHGDTIRARFMVLSPGGLHRAKLPGIPGLDEFGGKIFHTSRWDYHYTGGSPKGSLDGLGDKTVAVIGTGCTAVQCVPYLAESAKHLYVFQRTPASVDVRANAPTDPEWAASLEPGWQEARRRNFDDAYFFRPVEEVLVEDGWTAQVRAARELFPEVSDPPPTPEELGQLAELVDLQYNEGVRRRVDEMVEDPETRAKLKAWYRQFCKRPTFNDEYLPTFNRPNVTLVDTSGTKGVERLTQKGIFVGGHEYEVDCVIFATGFDLSPSITRWTGFEVVGEKGRKLGEYWAEGARTLHGLSVNGFPNQFIVCFGVQGVFGVNVTAILDDQAKHVAYLAKVAVERGARKIQPSAEAEAAWVDLVTGKAADSSGGGATALASADFIRQCTPSYYNNEGNPDGAVNAGVFPGTVNEFNELLADWRKTGTLDGIRLD